MIMLIYIIIKIRWIAETVKCHTSKTK